MTSPYLETSQRWCNALRTLMGYPGYAPGFHTTGWCASSVRDLMQALEVTQIAADKGCDLVHVAFALDADEPLGVSLAVRRHLGVEWRTGMRLYAASETAKIELLDDRFRWFIGPRLFLTSAKLPPKARREQGEQIAWRRWRHAAATIPLPKLEGSVMVPSGKGYAHAIPIEQLEVAA